VRGIDWEQKAQLYTEALAEKPFLEWLELADRAEQVDQEMLYAPIWTAVNAHYGTDARSFPELIDQLGIARFGKRPVVGDAFCGGGSIPFEAARLGCDVVASDLNPVACMLTWGALNIVGADGETRAQIETAQKEIAAAVDAEITALGIEHNQRGDRAKAYLYCLETRCPKTGYLVPMLPNRIISRSRGAIAVLVADHPGKRFDIRVENDASDEQLAEAEKGTVEDGELVVTLNGETHRTSIKTIRGDRRGLDGEGGNALRQWQKADFIPRPDDIFQERLYAVQWITKDTIGKSRQNTYFASVGMDDVDRERTVEAIVRENLSAWQEQGIVPEIPAPKQMNQSAHAAGRTGIISSRPANC
jgi:putative DNA methylase